MPDSYEVTSDRLAGHRRGDTVTADDFADDTNVAALIIGGHLSPQPKTKTKTKE